MWKIPAKCGQLAEDSATKLKRDQTKYEKLLTECVLPPTAEIFAGPAGNFRQYLANQKSWAKKYMVWLHS
jgi:hypothetical protein